MSSTKIVSTFNIMTVLGVASLVAAMPGQLIPSETAATQQGVSVVFFVAHPGMLRDLEYNPIIFTQILVNQGLGYNNYTGVFTAPIGGIYQFVFTAQLCRGDHNNHWYFRINGLEKMLCHAQITDGDTTLNTCFIMESLKKGDKVWIQQSLSSCAWASTTSKTITFSGILLARNSTSNLGVKYIPSTSLPQPPTKIAMSSSAGLSATLFSMAVVLLILFSFLE